ncbi:gliding motility-associated C-terminal domain-containing protein [Chitinophaga sp. GCM10012297]|uniref:Gliding motility-associated C-terminal domain-containing protein n=1 Tax=Chitinophaga chungangae TaxID=2821488 RepID=A0ABS3Y7V8_9BACT|nr:gliding motility-associated C-terminal domain-containing protein [Chitinophaga chungangae]MBO9150748.1 gliding motility-associated C-terminal domain-containing protein [Chitinophaga chungangae]
MRFFFLVICPLMLTAHIAAAQACTQIGQTPQSAFPICGTKELKQASVPLCAGRKINMPSCRDAVPPTEFTDRNPFWYKFTCYQAGTLGFTITPNDLSDDYDWQLFDVTGRNLDEVYTNPGIQVAGNWSEIEGLTGANNTGTRLMNCEGRAYPKWSSMPTLQVGHDYLLLVSHFTNTQSGYELAFGGGSAVITDPKPGEFTRAAYRCLNNRITVKFNKLFRCNTLAANGSDFLIAGTNAVVTSAAGVNCGNGFDMDSVVLTLDRPLPAGNYTLQVKTGSDGNTLLDACDNPIAAGRSIAINVPVPQAVPFDRIAPVGCKPDMIRVLLSDAVRCSSVAADGSDFRITGTGPAVAVVAAGTKCSGQLTDTIDLLLNGPVYLEGNYRIDLIRGADGNTLISECGVETALGQMVPFTTKDTVNATFNNRVRLDCVYDTIFLHHDGAHGVNTWNWSFEDGDTRTEQSPVKVYTVFGQKTATLKVSNGVCEAEHTENILLDNTLIAAFTIGTPVLCPLDLATFTNESTGNITGHRWDFGFGPGTRLVTPQPFRFPMTARDQVYQVRLIVTDNLQCEDTAVHTLKTVPSCRVAVPTAFTPNNDGVNDFLYPLNGYKTADLLFRVFARNGQLVFESRNWAQKWDGKINGSPAPVGTYAWVLEYTDTELGERVFQKGVATLLR